MKRHTVKLLFVGAAAILFVCSLSLCAAYAGPEPLTVYRRLDVLLFVGAVSAAIALWMAWALSLIAAVAIGGFNRRALLGLFLAVAAIFYLHDVIMGYLDDAERFMALSWPKTARANPLGGSSEIVVNALCLTPDQSLFRLSSPQSVVGDQANGYR